MAVPIKLPFYVGKTGVTCNVYTESNTLSQEDVVLTETTQPGMYSGSVNFTAGYFTVQIFASGATKPTGFFGINVVEDTVLADWADSIPELKHRSYTQTINVTLDPVLALDQETIEIKPLKIYNNSPTTVTIILDEGVFDGSTMRFVVENSSKVDLQVVEGLSSTTDTMSINIPSIPTQEDECGRWSIRYSSNNAIKTSGSVTFHYAAIKDT